GGVEFSADNAKLFAFSSVGLDTEALVAYDLTTGKRKVLAIEKGVDVKRALADPKSGVPQAYLRYWTEREWKFLGPALRADFDTLRHVDDGQIDVESRSRDGSQWIVSFVHTDYPTRYFLYDHKRHTSVLL